MEVVPEGFGSVRENGWCLGWTKVISVGSLIKRTFYSTPFFWLIGLIIEKKLQCVHFLYSDTSQSLSLCHNPMCKIQPCHSFDIWYKGNSESIIKSLTAKTLFILHK